MTRLIVQRNDIRQTRWEDTTPPALGDGAVRMRIDKFALTSNNITYANIGERMGYWQFFPTGDPTTGCVPIWGFAVVAESRVPGVAEGERFYGYYPIAEDVVLYPAPVDDAGFVDDAEHRRALPPIYNRYVRCSADPGYVEALEAQQALFRPLFATSFLLDDFLQENRFFGADTAILASVQQDVLRHRVLPGPSRREGAGDRPDVGGQPGLHPIPGLLRHGADLRRDLGAARR